MKYTKVTVFGVLITLLFFYLFTGNTVPLKPRNDRPSIDPVSKTPEWLKLRFEEVWPVDSSLLVWIPSGDFNNSSLVKVPRFPRKFTPREIHGPWKTQTFQITPVRSGHLLEAKVVKNERFSGQIAIAAKQHLTNLSILVSDLRSETGDIISQDRIQTRYVGYVPVQRAGSELDWSAKYEEVAGFEVSGNMSPDIVADPLLPWDKIDLPSHRAQPIWLSIDVPKEIGPMRYEGYLTIQSDQFPQVNLKIVIEVNDIVLPDSKDFSFFLDLWLNPSALAEQYHIPSWSNQHWEVIETYMQTLAKAGGKTITTIITHEPWRIPWTDGKMRPQTYNGFEGMIKWKRTREGSWTFDYSIFDRLVRSGMESGLGGRINAYSLTAFRGKEKIHFYDEIEGQTREVFFDSVEAPAYRAIWKIFLKDFKSHLEKKGWLDKTYLCFDERPNQTMQYITKMIKEVAPEFSNRIAISGHPESAAFATGFLALSYEFFPNQNLTKEETLSVIEDRNKTGRLTTFYLCGQPAHPNTLTFSPAVEARMIPWLALKYGTQGYLRWAFNSWPEKPFSDPVFNFVQGDEYMVYPGNKGPISSIRWELLKDGIEDFELYQLIAAKTETSQSQNIALALEKATQNEDGREKNINDLEIARGLLMNCFQTSQ